MNQLSEFSLPDFKVNVPEGTSGDVINGIIQNLPVIGALVTTVVGGLFGPRDRNQPPPPPPPPDLTPIYLMGGLILLITLTKK
jgi:hypothetical protein